MALYRDEGVVLRTYKLGEADRIVVLLTAGRGKVRAVAKGVRKTKSRFGGRLEPLSAVSLLCYEGRQLHTISQAETLEHHRALREDLARMTDAMALLEAADHVAQEGEPNPALYQMLRGALRALTETPSPLLVAGFYWKLLALEGLTPVLDRCVVCGAPGGVAAGDGGADGGAVGDDGGGGPAGGSGGLVAFDPKEGGVVCRSCRGPASLPTSPDALELIARILGGHLRSALAEPASPATAGVANLATAALEAHLERRLRVLRVLHP